MAFGLFVAVAASIHYGLAGLLGLAVMAREALLCCKTVFSWCLVSPSMLKALAPWVGLGVVTAGLAVACFRAGRALLLSRRFLRRIRPLRRPGHPVLEALEGEGGCEVIPFEDDVLKTAFTLGLSRPRVYVSTGLAEELTPEELRAVILHEIHHAVNRDPLRLFVVSFIRDTFFFLPLGRYLVDSFRVQKELAADEGAVAVTRRPLDLATALVKIATMRRRPLPAGVPVVGKEGLVEKRIRELVEPNRAAEKVPAGAAALTAAAVAVLVLAVSLPIYAETGEMDKCNHHYCLSGERVCPSDMKDCRRACELMERESMGRG